MSDDEPDIDDLQDETDPDPCPNCGTSAFQMLGDVGECGNENCSVLQFEAFRSGDSES